MKFFTGLPSFKVLKALFDFVAPPVDFLNKNPTKLSSFQEFMIVMAKLRLDSPLQDFAYRFDVSVATVSRILLKWLTILDTKLRPMIEWPEWCGDSPQREGDRRGRGQPTQKKEEKE